MKRTLVAVAVLAACLAVFGTGLAFASTPSHIKLCFGLRGVQFGSFNAALCEVKLGGNPSGALYFTPSVDEGLNKANPNGQMFWYKLHAAPNNFYVWENYSDPWGGTYPRNSGRIIALDEGKFGQCILDWPSWTVDPSGITCVSDGGHSFLPERPLTPAELNSVHEFQLNMRAAVPLEYR